MDIIICYSKTDQHAKGTWVSLSRNEDPKICPVELTRLYLLHLGYTSGFLMPAMSGRKPDPRTPLRYNTALLDLKPSMLILWILANIAADVAALPLLPLLGPLFWSFCFRVDGLPKKCLVYTLTTLKKYGENSLLFYLKYAVSYTHLTLPTTPYV